MATRPLDQDPTAENLDPNAKRIKTTLNMEHYKNTKGAPPVFWKKGNLGWLNVIGGVLHIPPSTPGYDQITEEEVGICSVLRILPEQYLYIKETILVQVERRGPFKKRDAKSWFRIDVNKASLTIHVRRLLSLIGSVLSTGSLRKMNGRDETSRAQNDSVCE